MNSLEEIAIEVAQKMDDVFLRNVPADVLRSYARRLVAALGAQEPVYVIFDGEPGNEGPRFVEVETANQNSVRAGEWSDYPLNKHLARLGPFFAAPVLPSVPEGMILVKTVKCPNCDDVGWYVVPGRDGEPEQEQCEFCETVPNSIFNISKIARLSAAPSPQEDAA